MAEERSKYYKPSLLTNCTKSFWRISGCDSMGKMLKIGKLPLNKPVIEKKTPLHKGMKSYSFGHAVWFLALPRPSETW